MRLLSLSLSLALFLPLAAACGNDSGAENYDTLQECVTDHVTEGLSEPHAITHCLVDFPFGDGLTTQQECIDYVTANGDYPDSRDEACTDFITETGQ
jgi:hypothetical protein